MVISVPCSKPTSSPKAPVVRKKEDRKWAGQASKGDEKLLNYSKDGAEVGAQQVDVSVCVCLCACCHACVCVCTCMHMYVHICCCCFVCMCTCVCVAYFPEVHGWNNEGGPRRSGHIYSQCQQ